MPETGNPAREAIVSRLISLPRGAKQLILAVSDGALLVFAVWFAFSLRLGLLYHTSDLRVIAVVSALPLLGMIAIVQLKLYRQVTRFIDQKAVFRLYLAITISVLIWSLVVLLSGVIGIPRSVIIIYWVLAGPLLVASRMFAVWIISGRMRFALKSRGERVLICGAGPMGVQLALDLTRSNRFLPTAILDPDPALHKRVAAGYRIYPVDLAEELIRRDDIRHIFLAMPDASR